MEFDTIINGITYTICYTDHDFIEWVMIGEQPVEDKDWPATIWDQVNEHIHTQGD